MVWSNWNKDEYLNTISNKNCILCGEICCYTDDTTFSKSDKDPNNLKIEIDNKYKLLEKYMHENKLVINGDKTHLLVMTTSEKHIKYGNYNITLNTGNEIIEPQDVEILLGRQISSNLKWFNHIMVGKKSMMTVLSSRINALSKMSAVASFKDRKI